MLEEKQIPILTRRETQYFLSWIEAQLLQESYTQKADHLLRTAAAMHTHFAQLLKTPQSPPHHAEGLVVADGIRRALAGLFAINDGKQLVHIEEFAREKHLYAEIHELQTILHEHVQTLALILLVHDIGKWQTFTFSSPKGSKGEREGFFTHKYRGEKNRQEDAQHYMKLYRAWEASHPNITQAECLAHFYDEYEIQVHYPDHADISAGIEQDILDALGEQLRVPARDIALARFIVREHMSFIEGDDKEDVERLELVTARAHKAGFDAEQATDMLLATVFLDGCIGSLQYEHGQFSANIALVLRMMRAEEQVAPHRRKQRREKMEMLRRATFKQILKKHGLDAESIFALLNIPFGPERGVIMHNIQDCVRYPSVELQVSSHKHELQARIDKARADFDAIRES